jgi:putative chitinase
MNALEILQRESGVEPDRVFGPKTFKAGQKHLGIDNDVHAVHFFAQCGHETGGFKRFEENLNYSKKGLLATWPSRYNEELAERHHRKPELIANHVYDRVSLGNTKYGDGWKYRGRGAIQLTGMANYKEFSEYMCDPTIVARPQKVAHELGFMAAVWFFDDKGVFSMCEDLSESTVKRVTKRINGGYNGLKHRLELTEKYAKYIR